MIRWISDSWLTLETGMRDRLSQWLCRCSLIAWGADDADGWNCDVVTPIKVNSDIESTAKRLGLKI